MMPFGAFAETSAAAAPHHIAAAVKVFFVLSEPHSTIPWNLELGQ